MFNTEFITLRESRYQDTGNPGSQPDQDLCLGYIVPEAVPRLT